MPRVPDAVQGLIDAVDAQIQKDRSPVVNVVLGTPLFLIVSLPLAFIVGVVVLLFTGTTSYVAQETATPGIIAGLITMLVFWLFASYGTYSSSRA